MKGTMKARKDVTEQGEPIKVQKVEVNRPVRFIRHWALENVQTRIVASRLNELSSKGPTIFAVNQSAGIGGTYEVLSYFDKAE